MEKRREEKWEAAWSDSKIFESNPDEREKKSFVTVPFPYMNGPMHIGHGFTACRVDVYARFKRMEGYNTLFPYAWHWTGQPIVAASERLSKGDSAMVKEFVEIDGIPLDKISKFYDPEYMARYYTESGKTALKRLGLSIDWRREFHTTSLEPTFNRFILWQMKKLRSMGYITKGTHPVVWCPRDQSPTGDHDRLEGEGITWEEYTLVLFSFSGGKFRGVKLPAATFRPETIFGVTNLWINPDAKYVLISVNEKEEWIVSEKAASKLADQLKKIKILRIVSGSELIGTKIAHPLEHRDLLILPANFVDPNNGSGIVYGVPAHAPMDYVALRDLKNDFSTQERFGLNSEEIDLIKPISLISIPGMGEFPALEIVEKMGIKNQEDLRVEQATNEIYKKEFHQGVLNKNTGKFELRKVSEAKPLIVNELKEKGLADFLYDLPEKVVCRCTTVCTVKILEDQWFLKYSDSAWKSKAHECINQSSIYPESARQWFHDVIDWIKDWPCARKVGLGTPLPWSPGWIVETLSDSTIYMAFYTISYTLRKESILEANLTDELFDYVFQGEGELSEVSKGSKISPEIIEQMRREFLYWYPVNLRNSAKELIPNHLLFFVFQHVAFFQKELWPSCISVNGMMMNEGIKMSKSKGNVITLAHALDVYGADTLRAALVNGAEGMDDVDWRVKYVDDLKTKISNLPGFVANLLSHSDEKRPYGEEELLLESLTQRRISQVARYIESMKMKSAFQEAFFDFWNDVRYYLVRVDTPSKRLMNYVVETWIRLLSPFIPYTCEEINSQMGEKGMVSISQFPKPDPSKSHPEAEVAEMTIRGLISDAQNIKKLIKEEISTIHIYLADKWAYHLLWEAIVSREKSNKMSDTLEAFFSSHPEISRKDAAKMLPRIAKELNELGDDFIKNYSKSAEHFDEARTYTVSEKYLEVELGAKIRIHLSDEPDKYDPKGKSQFALPLKPALFLE